MYRSPLDGESNPYGEVGHNLAPDLAELVALVVKHLNAVSYVFGDENLYGVVDDNAIRKLEEPAM